jgi:hypothetical protein
MILQNLLSNGKFDLIGNSRWPPTQNSVHHRSIYNECFYGDQESKMVAAARHSIT